MTARSDDWEIPHKIWMILLSWGAGVIILTMILSFWIWSTQKRVSDERDRVQREQDRAMCAMVEVFLDGPEPVAGPAGDRSRAVRDRMIDYRNVLRCADFEDEPPVKPRD